MGVARTLSGLLLKEPTNTLASVEPPSPCAPRGGRVWPGRLRIVSIRRILSVRPGKGYCRALPLQLATVDLARVPRIQVFRPPLPKRYRGQGGLGDAAIAPPFWDWSVYS